MLAILFPNIDPVIVKIGPLSIRWYAMAYVLGILIGEKIIKYLCQYYPKKILTAEKIETISIWSVFGIVIGGRLGYFLFYISNYTLSDIILIPQIWKGGMSFHGGVFGLAVSLFICCKKNNIPYLELCDLISCVAPIGLFLGRIANFINGELYGRVTNVPWAVYFPEGGPFPRHPSQIYEAFLEGIILGIIMLISFFKTKFRFNSGKLSGIFLALYGIFRTIVENYREPDYGASETMITQGQLLSIPLIIMGFYFFTINHKKN
jgi:phosphatidylglycerol:prolipoprotein diacylglycerol transferase